MGITDNIKKEGGIKVKDINLVDALDVVLNKKAERFISNEGYLEHIRQCVEELNLTDPKLAFLFGGLDAMQQDFGSAAQMTRPPASQIDVSFRGNRKARLLNWMNDWKARGVLPFQKKIFRVKR